MLSSLAVFPGIVGLIYLENLRRALLCASMAGDDQWDTYECFIGYVLIIVQYTQTIVRYQRRPVWSGTRSPAVRRWGSSAVLNPGSFGCPAQAAWYG